MNVAASSSPALIGTTVSGEWVRCPPDRLGPTRDHCGHAVQRVWVWAVARVGVLHTDSGSIRPEDQDPVWQVGHPQVRAPRLHVLDGIQHLGRHAATGVDGLAQEPRQRLAGLPVLRRSRRLLKFGVGRLWTPWRRCQRGTEGGRRPAEVRTWMDSTACLGSGPKRTSVLEAHAVDIEKARHPPLR